METPGVRQRVPYDRADAIAAAWEAYYKRSRKGKGWKGCQACPPQRRDPGAPVQVHHVVSKQRLKRYAQDNRLSYLQLLRLLTDPRNSMLVCDPCHGGHTSRMKPLPRRAIAGFAWDFVDELGLRDEILEEYPA